MSDILSQSEIEALLSSLADEGVLDQSQAPGRDEESFGGSSASSRINTPTVAYELYDFRRPDKMSKEQLRTIQMVHETFARLAGTNLSAYLRSQVNIELISLEQIPYEEYLRGINRSVFVISSMPPLSGQAVFEMEFEVVLTMIDRLLGGPGKPILRTVLTDIEQPLVRQIADRLFTTFRNSWESVVMLNPGIEGIESSAQFVQIAPPNDIVLTILFEVKIGEVRGAMSICIPYLLLKPISSKLTAQKWFVSGSKKQSTLHRALISKHVLQSKVDCIIYLGKTRLSIQDFLNLQKGDVLDLHHRSHQPLPFTISDNPKFEGRPALSGKKLAFHITERIE